MRDAVPAINAGLAGELPFALGIGIAINTGPAVVGNFGTARRFDYSAMGDAVNVAARLQEETKTYGIAIALGAETAARLPGFAILPIDVVQVRGRAQPVELCALVGDEAMGASPAFVQARERQSELLTALRGPNRRAAAAAIARQRLEAPPYLTPVLAAYAARLEEGGTATALSDAAST
jgi:adenylate cyclase